MSHSYLDFYPCGAYEITKDGEMQICKLKNNLSEKGAGKKVMNDLFTKGVIENFSSFYEFNYKNRNINKIIILFLLLIFIFILVK